MFSPLCPDHYEFRIQGIMMTFQSTRFIALRNPLIGYSERLQYKLASHLLEMKHKVEKKPEMPTIHKPPCRVRTFATSAKFQQTFDLSLGINHRHPHACVLSKQAHDGHAFLRRLRETGFFLFNQKRLRQISFNFDQTGYKLVANPATAC